MKFQAQDLPELPKFKTALEYRDRFTFGHEKIDSILDFHLEVNMAAGLGVTEFMLRIMGWLCTSTELYKNSISQMVIVTGPNQDLAIKLIKRLKAISLVLHK